MPLNPKLEVNLLRYDSWLDFNVTCGGYIRVVNNLNMVARNQVLPWANNDTPLKSVSKKLGGKRGFALWSSLQSNVNKYVSPDYSL